MENEDTKYSDRAKQVEENVINKSKMVEEHDPDFDVDEPGSSKM